MIKKDPSLPTPEDQSLLTQKSHITDKDHVLSQDHLAEGGGQGRENVPNPMRDTDLVKDARGLIPETGTLEAGDLLLGRGGLIHETVSLEGGTS